MVIVKPYALHRWTSITKRRADNALWFVLVSFHQHQNSPQKLHFLVDFISCTDLFLHTLQTNIVSFSGLEEVFMCLEIEMFCFFTETNATVVRTICYYRIDATHTTFQVNTTRATQSNHGTQFNSHIALDANQCNSHNLRNSMFTTQPNNATYSTFTISTRQKVPTLIAQLILTFIIC